MAEERPTIIVPYSGPCQDPDVEDIVLFLRPEANGVLAESCMLRALREDPAWGRSYRLAYLANLPGEFMAERRILERRYALRDRFAREGGRAFTETMKRLFEAHFRVPFDPEIVVGAYEALGRLGMSEEGLFQVWVEEKDFARIHQQSVKRIGDLFVVNYDIPALLRRTPEATDVFAMVLRSFAPYAEVHLVIRRMCAALEQAGILSTRRPPSRIFHYSTSPFMQILDGMDYIYEASGNVVDPMALSFYAYLIGAGVDGRSICSALEQPIMRFRTPEGVAEWHLFDYTHEDSFPEALEKFRTRVP